MSKSIKVRCEPCCGTGVKGRYEGMGGRRAWKIRACRTCGGSGERWETPAVRRRRERDEAAARPREKKRK